MKVKHLNLYKRILITQLLCIGFAIISEVHIRLVIANDWWFTNVNLLAIEFFILTILFTILITLFLDGIWINILIISIPYCIYYIIVLWISSKIFPTHISSEDYGVGLIGVSISFFQWISIMISSIIGTFIRRYFHGCR
jgi:hypothetical protein